MYVGKYSRHHRSSGQSESWKNQSHLVVVEKVRGLKIAVDVPVAVHVLHGANELQHQALDLPQRERPLSPFHHRRQGPTKAVSEQGAGTGRIGPKVRAGLGGFKIWRLKNMRIATADS